MSGCDLEIPKEKWLNYLQTDPDQKAHSVASDLDLHCLPITLFCVSRQKWDKQRITKQ